MNECERLGTPFTENYEYYTDYSATPDSTISTNYNNVDQLNSNMEISTPRDTNGTDAPIEPKSTDETIVCAKEADTKLLENPVENPNAATATSNSSQSPAKEKPTKKSNNKVVSTIFFYSFFSLLINLNLICRPVIRALSKNAESEKI